MSQILAEGLILPYEAWNITFSDLKEISGSISVWTPQLKTARHFSRVIKQLFIARSNYQKIDKTMTYRNSKPLFLPRFSYNSTSKEKGPPSWAWFLFITGHNPASIHLVSLIRWSCGGIISSDRIVELVTLAKYFKRNYVTLTTIFANLF